MRWPKAHSCELSELPADQLRSFERIFSPIGAVPFASLHLAVLESRQGAPHLIQVFKVKLSDGHAFTF